MSDVREQASLAAIEELYERRHRHFLRVAYALLGDSDQAGDAVQEAFARALRSRSDFRGDGSLEAWVWRTLTNVCLKEMRQRSARASGAPSPDAGASSANAKADEWPELRAAIAALPERQRLILFLRHYADLDQQRIAEVVGVERGTVAATLHAAHAALRKTIVEVQA